MTSKCLIKRKLPDAPEPTKAAYKKPVIGEGKYIRVIPSVYNPRPAPIPKPRKKPKAVKKPEKKKGYKREVHQTPRFWTQERIDTLVDLHRQGFTYEGIAEQMGTTRGAVSSIVNRLMIQGVVETRNNRFDWPQEDIDKLIELKEKGLTMGEIADKLGRNPKSCYAKWRLMNVKQAEMQAVFRRMADGGEHH